MIIGPRYAEELPQDVQASVRRYTELVSFREWRHLVGSLSVKRLAVMIRTWYVVTKEVTSAGYQDFDGFGMVELPATLRVSRGNCLLDLCNCFRIRR